MVNKYTIDGLGKRIRARRVELKLSREKMANLIDKLGGSVDPQTIKSWELEWSKCSVINIPYLCQALDCDTEYLFGNSITPHKVTADISEVTGLASETVARLIKVFQAHASQEPIQFEDSLLFTRETIVAIDILIQNFFGNQLLYILFNFIHGNVDKIGLMGRPNENEPINGFRSQVTKDDFFFEVYDKSRQAVRTYDAEEFAKLMKNSTFTELQETIFKLRDEALKKENRSGEH
jgi:DNA-binding XRE family transcriptional regulator